MTDNSGKLDSPKTPVKVNFQLYAMETSVWKQIAGVFLLSLGVYVFTMPPTVTLEDSGLFITTCKTLGIAHPPGYPTYIMIGHLFTKLPWGSVAERVHLVSAIFGAATCALLWIIAWQCTGKHRAAWLAGMGLALSDTFWSQAIIAEVYTLNTFFFFLVLALLLRFAAQGNTSSLLGAAFVFGLSLTNHLSLMLLAAPGFLIIVLVQWKLFLRRLPVAFCLVVLGMTPYIYLVIRSQQNPDINFIGPITNWQEFWDVFSRKLYKGIDHASGASIADRQAFGWLLSRELLLQFTPLGLLLAMAGWLWQCQNMPRRFLLGMTASALGCSVALVFLLSFHYEAIWAEIFKVYPLPTYGLVALWMGMGLLWIRSDTVAVMLGIVIVTAMGIVHYPDHQRSNDTWARDYASYVLEQLDKDAVYFTQSDLDTGPLAYLNMVEGVRSDVTLMHAEGLFFNQRVSDSRTHTTKRERVEAIQDFLLDTERPVYSTADLSHGYGIVNFGLFQKIEMQLPEGIVLHRLTKASSVYLQSILKQAPSPDPWSRFHRQILLSRFSESLVHIVQDGGTPEQLQWLQTLQALPYSNLGMATAWLQLGQPDQAWTCLQRAEQQDQSQMLKKHRAILWRLRAQIQNEWNRNQDEIISLQRSIAIFPDVSNKALLTLLSRYAYAGNNSAYQALRKQFQEQPELQRIFTKLDKIVTSNSSENK